MDMRKLILIAALAIFATACKKDNPPEPYSHDLKEGIFILNEGNFNSSNASLSYFESESKETTSQLFFKQNNAPLGDVANSILVEGENANIVVNNSGLVYVIDRKTAEYKGKIAGLFSPRNILVVNEQKAYVSNLSYSRLTIVNLEEYSILGEIEIGRSSEEMVKLGDEVFVANWSAYNQTKTNDKVMVINSQLDVLVDSITVGIEPNSMVIDKDGKLWVLCSGGFENIEKPTLWRVDPVNRQILQKFEFQNINSSPTELESNKEKDTLYFINEAVFKMAILDTELPQIPFINNYAELAYRLAIDPRNNDIYLTDALDYTRNGFVYHFNAEGQILDTIVAGIIPSNIGFNFD